MFCKHKNKTDMLVKYVMIAEKLFTATYSTSYNVLPFCSMRDLELLNLIIKNKI